ncbi:hypothetical protein [Deinococcus peraridilitoris]|uniref:Uncharacterized protein n=1 Tax=Deinococcus peraridilitoris (strain DSM 19664 / LMG 22246 / CIP 109416 / KR-200) TaxID=937777 RepID=L0A217_DEIPD|nr:hypothetical protein [Deinococcus peraridilitoris]AFZ67943.1 hypothetical protein Deipe_2471 [Deinococcus peraridilitoris DSM 19664]
MDNIFSTFREQMPVLDAQGEWVGVAEGEKPRAVRGEVTRSCREELNPA